MTRFPYSLKTFEMKFGKVYDLTFSFTAASMIGNFYQKNLKQFYI